jgi:hypothetical protein
LFNEDIYSIEGILQTERKLKQNNMKAVEIIVIGLYYVLVLGLIRTFLKLLSK